MADTGHLGGVGRRVPVTSLRAETRQKSGPEKAEHGPEARAALDVSRALKTTAEAKDAVSDLKGDAVTVRRQVAVENRAASEAKPRDVEKLAKAIARAVPQDAEKAVGAHKLDGEQVVRLTES